MSHQFCPSCCINGVAASCSAVLMCNKCLKIFINLHSTLIMLHPYTVDGRACRLQGEKPSQYHHLLAAGVSKCLASSTSCLSRCGSKYGSCLTFQNQRQSTWHASCKHAAICWTSPNICQFYKAGRHLYTCYSQAKKDPSVTGLLTREKFLVHTSVPILVSGVSAD